MAQIIAPNKDYTGVSASVPFVKGVGETSDAYLIEWFKEHGYTVIEDDAAEVPPEAPETPETEAADATEQVESEPEAGEQVEETPEKPKRTRSSRAKAADAE
jgi:hypothetical protein